MFFVAAIVICLILQDTCHVFRYLELQTTKGTTLHPVTPSNMFKRNNSCCL